MSPVVQLTISRPGRRRLAELGYASATFFRTLTLARRWQVGLTRRSLTNWPTLRSTASGRTQFLHWTIRSPETPIILSTLIAFCVMACALLAQSTPAESLESRVKQELGVFFRDKPRPSGKSKSDFESSVLESEGRHLCFREAPGTRRDSRADDGRGAGAQNLGTGGFGDPLDFAD